MQAFDTQASVNPTMSRRQSKAAPFRLHSEASSTEAASFLRRDAACAAAVIFIWLAATAWVRPLLLPDEGRYVGVAWEMLRSGDWLTPTLDGLPFFHKPPLFYWITAASLSVFGMNEWAARVAPLLGAWSGAFAAYVFLRRWASLRLAHLALVALLAQPLFFAGAQYANLDMLVAGCIAATVFLTAHAALSAEYGLPYRRALALAYAAAGFGVLAKGLIGCVLPALVVVAWLAARRRWRLILRLVWLPGIAAFLLVAAPWFVAMQLRFADFFDAFFIEQHFRRFAAGGFNNPQPFWFFPAVLLLASLPWLPWIYRAVWQNGLRKAMQDPVRLLMLVWVVIVTLFFSLPKSKLVGYIFPVLVPLAVLAAEGFGARGKPSPKARQFWWLGTTLGVALGLTALSVYTFGTVRTSRSMALALAADRKAHEPVVMLDRYDYDVPFYARLADPIRVVSNWSDPDLYKRDDWRKELAQAGQFAPARSAAVLLEPAALTDTLCAAPVSWVVADTRAAADHPVLRSADAVFTERGTTLWRLDAQRLANDGVLNCSRGTGIAPLNRR